MRLRTKLLSVLASGVIALTGIGITRVVMWSNEGPTRYTCLHPTSVDYGEGFGHARAVYDKEGITVYPDENRIGEFTTGHVWCGQVDFANGGTYIK